MRPMHLGGTVRACTLPLWGVCWVKDETGAVESACGAADGGDTSEVDGKLKNCNVTSMVSNDYAIAVACEGGGAVGWGDKDCMPRLS